MNLSHLSVALAELFPQGANPHRLMGAAKVLLQTQGINLFGIQVPANSDSAGSYLILRDDLLKIDVPMYAHRSIKGYRVTTARTALQACESVLSLEFERPYFSLRAEIDEVPFRDICNIEYDGHLALTANHGCLYFKDETACKFCAIPQWRDAEDRSIKRLVEASAHALSMGEVRHLSLTTGTTPGPDRGIRSVLTVLTRLSERVDIKGLPIFAEFEPPQDLDWIDRLRDAGVTTVSCNLEFLMSFRRRRYMPGKGAIPFDRFLGAWERMVAIFGRGQVFSNILMTADDVSLRDQFASEELEAMIGVGVIPSPGPLYPDPASEMHATRLPSVADQMGFLEDVAHRLYNENLDPRRALAGCHRNGSYSAINQFYAARTLNVDIDSSGTASLVA